MKDITLPPRSVSKRAREADNSQIITVAEEGDLMIEASLFLEEAGRAGFSFFTGVPCSFLTPLMNAVIGHRNARYVAATSEGEAVGIAAGAWLAGKQTVVMLQNSGLGNTVNPLTSLNHPFRIPTLIIVTWRGGPGIRDEPQHELMGEITPALLETIRVPHRPFPAEPALVRPRMEEVSSIIRRTSLPVALILEHGGIESHPLEAPAFEVRPRGEIRREDGEDGDRPSRFEVLGRLIARLPAEVAVVATTGKCGRELFTLGDRAQQLYQVGSMGCASAMGLGIALNTRRKVVVLDGDGAALMKLGSLATIGAYSPANLIHVLLDNAVHDSTGAQPTVSPNVDFCRVAQGTGYRSIRDCSRLATLDEAIDGCLRDPGPHFLHVRIKPGSIEKLGRPSIPPHAVAQRFRTFLTDAAPA